MYIKGVGPKRAEVLEKDGLSSPEDILYYAPRTYIDRAGALSIKEITAKLNREQTFEFDKGFSNFSLKNEISIVAKLIHKQEKELSKKRTMLVFTLSDGSGEYAQIIFWNYTKYFSKAYEAGETLFVSGNVELNRNGVLCFNHPEIELFDEEDEASYRSGKILPVYPLKQNMRNAKISVRILRKITLTTIEKYLYLIKESLPKWLIDEFKLPSKQESIKNLHFPENRKNLIKAVKRLKFEEILYFEIFLALRYKGIKTKELAPLINPKSVSARRLYDKLPFKLTSDQKRAIREISEDINSGMPMNRLLQGDVGSGKTIVAVLSMLMAIDNGIQTAIMAPTETLAEQHFHTFSKMLDGFNIGIGRLLGGQRTRQRREILDKISSGECKIIIGTHALFQADIVYNRLGLIIIDEQHRFGVAQRAELKVHGEKSFEGKELSPHILVMSATPIPRTLSMTLYGDLDVSIIREKPANRLPIRTKVVFDAQIEEAYDFIRNEIKSGRQAYIVYPLVEKSEKIDFKSAIDHYDMLKEEVFPDFHCGLLHGQMFWYEKEETMRDFLEKKYDILVATTVIEVGIDVPNATVMMIEDAERFGLSQLHQLRGRVGRSSYQSYCLLVTKDKYKFALNKKVDEQTERKSAIIRLKTMEEISDGFKIAEVDLQLRGPGDVMGTRQSGLPDFKFLNLAEDGNIVAAARKQAFLIIEKDANLSLPENELIRNEFLKRFEKDRFFFDIA